jgi:cellulose synthase operon protein C
MIARWRLILSWLFIALLLSVTMVAGSSVEAAVSKSDQDRAERFFSDAQKRLQAGDLAAAMIELRNALQRNPDHLSARLLLGDLSLQAGNPLAAEKEYRRHYETTKDPRSGAKLAWALVQLRRFEDALKLLGPEGSSTLDGARVMGYALASLNRLGEAEAAFRAMLSIDPRSHEAMAQVARLRLDAGDIEAGRTMLETLFAIEPNSLEGWLLKSELAQKLNRTTEAREAVDKALALEPRNQRALFQKARIALASGRANDAEAAIREVLARSPNNALGLFHLALIQHSQRKFTEADKNLLTVEDQLREWPPFILLSGHIRLEVGQMAVAERAFARYSALEPDDARGPMMLAAVHLRRDNNSAAIEVLETFLKRRPNEAPAIRLLASAYLRAGDYDKAAQTLERWSQIQRNESAVRQAQGALSLLGKASAADIGALAAIDMVPGDDVSKAILLAHEHLTLGEVAEAKSILQAPLKSHPNNPFLRSMLGRIEVNLGDSAAGRLHYEHALKSAPDFTPALIGLIFLDAADGKPEAATARVRQAAARPATPLALIVQFADALSNTGQQAEAEALLRERLAQQPDNVELLGRLLTVQFRLPERQGALETARGLVQLAKMDARIFAVGASALFELGQKDEAKAAFRQAIAVAPTNDNVRLAFALYLAANQEQGEARKQLLEILKQQPGHASAVRRLIDLNLMDKNVDEARAVQQRFKGDPVETARLKAYLELRTGQRPAAIETLGAAIQQHPVPVLALELFALRASSGDSPGAIAEAKAWLAKRPDDNMLRTAMANQLLAQNDTSGAIGEFEMVLAKEPRSAIVLNNLAWLMRDSDRARAIGYSRRALALAPRSPEIQDTYGYLLMQAGNLTEALRLLQLASSASRNPEIHTHYAMALKEKGDRKAALDVLDRVLQSTALTDTQRQSAEKLRSSIQN